MRKKVRGLRAIERTVLEAARTPPVARVEDAPIVPVATPLATEPPPWTDLVLDYCAVTRGILNDDQGTTLDPAGVRMARALEEVKVSLDVCRDAKKGGSPKGC